MWPARAAVRPVPRHAVVPEGVVHSVEQEFTGSDRLEQRIDRAFDELDRDQPALALFLGTEMNSIGDETAQALGHFLGVMICRTFVAAFGERLRRVETSAIESASASFTWDEELRQGAADEALETDDVVAIGQPHLVHFVREQLDAAMEADIEGEPSDVDIESVAKVYRAVLVAILALGQAVDPPHGVAANVLM